MREQGNKNHFNVKPTVVNLYTWWESICIRKSNECLKVGQNIVRCNRCKVGESLYELWLGSYPLATVFIATNDYSGDDRNYNR